MAPGRVIGVLAFVILSLGAAVARAESPTSLAKAFIETLSEDESQPALAGFGSSDRMGIRFTPGRRGGLSLKAVDTETWLAATRLLQQTLRIEGFRMVEIIRQREAILGEITDNPDYRDPKLYYLAIFGDPGSGLWAYRTKDITY